MAIAKLSIDLETRLASFEKDMKTMASFSEGAAKRMEGAFKGVGLVLTGLAGALSVGALKGVFDNYVQGAAKLDDFGEIVGSTTEKVSGLVAVAKVSGTDLDLLQGAMVKLAKSTALAGDESTSAGAAFKSLRLDPAEMRLLDTSDQLKLLADRLAEYDDESTKTAVAVQLLGKSGAQLLPYLKDLAASGDLVVKVTSEQAATAEEYEKNLKRLALAQSAVAKTISAEVLPVANTFVKTMIDMVNGTDGVRGAAKELAADGSIASWAEGAARAAAFVIDAFDGVIRITQVVGKGLGALGAQVAAVATGNFSQASEIEKLYQVDREAILSRKLFSTALDENIAKLKSTGAAAVDTKKKLNFTGGASASVGGKGKASRDTNASFTDYDQQLTQKIASAIEKTDIVKAAELVRQLQKLDELAAAGLDPAIVQAVRDDLSGAAKAAADELARLNKLLDETPTAKLEAVRDDMQLMTVALEKGRISEEQYLEAVVARLDKVSEKTKEAAGEMDEFTKGAVKNIESTLADFLYDPFSEGADGIAEKWGKTLQRMAADASAAKLGRLMFGDMGKTGEVGGWVGSAFGVLKDILPSFDVGTDYVPRDMVAQIHKGERIVPAAQNKPAMQGGSISLTQHFHGQADARTVKRAGAAALREVSAISGNAVRYV
jgi:hypothetical protein